MRKEPDIPEDFEEGVRDVEAGRTIDLDTALTEPFPKPYPNAPELHYPLQ